MDSFLDWPLLGFVLQHGCLHMAEKTAVTSSRAASSPLTQHHSKRAVFIQHLSITFRERFPLAYFGKSVIGPAQVSFSMCFRGNGETMPVRSLRVLELLKGKPAVVHRGRGIILGGKFSSCH